MIMGIAFILLIAQQREPFRTGYNLKRTEKEEILLRAVLGWLITFLINAVLSMIPFTLMVILF